MNNYKEFKITTQPFNSEILSSVLWQLELLGINEYDNYLTIFTNEDSEITTDNIAKILSKLKEENLIDSFSIEEDILPNKNWNEEWEKKVNVVEISDKIVIKPSFKTYKGKENQIIIEIDPKMSFGTGEHATTKMVLLLLEKHFMKDAKVLDIGSGTAVLSIAASKLGAKEVIAIDNDEWCFINGNENIERNNLNNVKVLHSTIDNLDENNFDLILANINKNVLLDIKKSISEKCKNNGTVILSGILETDELEIKRQFAQVGLTAFDQKQIDEWIGIVFKKTNT
jgi:ribosomal protein L11 methyltransferase